MNEVEQPINSLSLSFEEALYANYLRDPDSVAPDWRQYFDELSHSENGGSKANGDSGDHADDRGNGNGNGHTLRLGPTFRPGELLRRASDERTATATNPPRSSITPAPAAAALRLRPPSTWRIIPSRSPRPPRPSDNLAILQDRVDQLIRAYRVRGHMVANLDPLGLPRPELPELDPRTYRLHRSRHGSAVFDRHDRRSASDDAAAASSSGCETPIAVRSACSSCTWTISTVRQWLQERMEGSENRLHAQPPRAVAHSHAADQRGRCSRNSFRSDSWAPKAFRSKGPKADSAAWTWRSKEPASSGPTKSCWRMAHRGRLNVLANIMGKSPQQIFREFADIDPELHIGRGDVKYHLGHSTDWTTSSGQKVHLSLCFNPSHLEFVNPVAVGRVRAKQDRVDDMRAPPRPGAC